MLIVMVKCADARRERLSASPLFTAMPVHTHTSKTHTRTLVTRYKRKDDRRYTGTRSRTVGNDVVVLATKTDGHVMTCATHRH
jgi:hypothetical protein